MVWCFDVAEDWLRHDGACRVAVWLPKLELGDRAGDALLEADDVCGSW